MFDCGEGTQQQLLRSEDFRAKDIDLIMITHLHGDHCMGLHGVLSTLNRTRKRGRAGLLRVVGPRGIRELVEGIFSVTQSRLGYDVEFVELVSPDAGDVLRPVAHEPYEEGERGDFFFTGCHIYANQDGLYELPSYRSLAIFAIPIKHRVFCLGYYLKGPDLPSGLDINALYLEYGLHFGRKSPSFLQEHGLSPFNFKKFHLAHPTIPRGFTKALARGEDVSYTVEGEERIIVAASVLNPPKIGKRFLYLGDTCSPDVTGVFAAHFAGSQVDCLVHECTFPNDMEAMAIKRGHSTPKIAGTFANLIQPKKLVLNHFSPRFSPGEIKGFAEECRETFDGDVVIAEDFGVVTF